ncbi:MAG: FecR domain-containing protein [Pseudomonadota bacterium]
MAEQESNLMREALKWRSIVDSDSATPKDQENFQVWLETDPSHHRALAEARRFWNELRPLSDIDLNHLRSEQTFARVRPAVPYLSFLPLALAATVLVAVCVVTWALWPNAVDVEPTRFATNVGEVRLESLQDGSAVTLGPKTQLSVLVTDHRREVQLIGGSAHFDVQSEPRPFQVITEGLIVEVTGTEFEVHRSTSGTSVAVEHGAVDVSGGNSLVTVEQGQKVFADVQGQMGEVRAYPAEKVASWRHNRLAYEEAPLQELIDDLNRYRHRPVYLVDESLAELTVTATFNATDVDLILNTLTQLYPLDIVESADKTELRRR